MQREVRETGEISSISSNKVPKMLEEVEAKKDKEGEENFLLSSPNG
jgi:hypothetical protein